MHIDDPLDNDAIVFNDTMEAFVLMQLVNMLTHNRGNTLDLIFSENGSTLRPSKVLGGAMLSDHYVIMISLSIKKAPVYRKKI